MILSMSFSRLWPSGSVFWLAEERRFNRPLTRWDFEVAGSGHGGEEVTGVLRREGLGFSFGSELGGEELSELGMLFDGRGEREVGWRW